jgi:hypothetical protein
MSPLRLPEASDAMPVVEHVFRTILTNLPCGCRTNTKSESISSSAGHGFQVGRHVRLIVIGEDIDGQFRQAAL